MRTLLAFLLCALNLSALAQADVSISVTNSDGSLYNGKSYVLPIGPVRADGSFFVRGVIQVVTHVNGVAHAKCMAGNYAVTNSGMAFCFAVPTDTGSYSANSTKIGGFNIFEYVPGITQDTATNIFNALYTNVIIAGITNNNASPVTLLNPTNQFAGTLKDPTIPLPSAPGMFGHWMGSPNLSRLSANATSFGTNALWIQGANNGAGSYYRFAVAGYNPTIYDNGAMYLDGNPHLYDIASDQSFAMLGIGIDVARGLGMVAYDPGLSLLEGYTRSPLTFDYTNAAAPAGFMQSRWLANGRIDSWNLWGWHDLNPRIVLQEMDYAGTNAVGIDVRNGMMVLGPTRLMDYDAYHTSDAYMAQSYQTQIVAGVVINTNGWVAVAHTNPAYAPAAALDVGGNIVAGGTISVDGGSITSDGIGNLSAHTLTTTANATVGGTLSVNGGQTIVGHDLNVIGGNVKVTGGSISSTNYLGDLGYATNADYAAFGDELIQPVPYRGMCSWYSPLGDAVTGNDLTNWANIAIANSLPAYGWKIIELDDGWQTNRAANGYLGWNTNKLGNLISFINWIHANGMLFGIYTEPKATTDDGKTGSDLPYTEQDAAAFASWGVDYVKLDFTGFGDENQMRYIVRRWRNAFRKSGRQVAVYSGGWRMNDSNWNMADTVRTLTASRWNSDYQNDPSVYASYVDNIAPYLPYVRPGHYLDVDIVAVSNSFTNNTAVMYGMNCVLGLPTMVSSFNNDSFSLGMYKNADLLAIQQDPQVHAASLISSNGVSEVWSKRLIDGRVALALWNRDTNNSQTISVNFNALGLSPTAVTKMKNVWSGAYSYATGAYSQSVVKAYMEVFLLSQTQLGPGVTEEVRAGAWALDSAATRLSNNTESSGNYSYDDGILNAGNVATSIRLAVPAGVSNVCAIGWYQCSGTQWWTNDLFSFTYSADPAVGRQINNFSSPQVQGTNGLVPFAYYFPFSDTNTPKMISIRLNAGTNSANRHVLSPIKLIYN